MADFNLAYPISSKNEGGYANVVGDTGLETYAGISRKWFPKWGGWAIVDGNKPIKHNAILKDEKLKQMVKAFYKIEFWDKVCGDQIDSQEFANRLYDSAINFGVPKAIRAVYKSFNLPEDTRMSQSLINKINEVKYV